MAINWDEAVLAPLMSEDVFGEPATYKPAVGSPFPITGVFDEAYRDLNMDPQDADLPDAVPVLGVRLAAFPVQPQDGSRDKVLIAGNGVVYAVREVRPDGHGGAKLMLNKHKVQSL